MAFDPQGSSPPADGTPAGAAGDDTKDVFGAEFERIAKAAESQPATDPAAAKPESPPASGVDDKELAQGETQQPSATTAAKPAASSAPADAVVDWSKASPEYKSAYENLAQKTTRLQGQVSSLSRKVHEQTKSQPAHTPAAEASPDAAAGAGKPPAAKSAKADAISKIVADYPEFAPLAESVANVEKNQEQLANAQRLAEEQRREDWLDQQDQLLTQRHPDYLALTQGEPGRKMAAWVTQQPKFIQDIATSNAHGIVDVDGADFVLKQYKASLGISPGADVPQQQTTAVVPPNPTAARRSAQLEGSTTVRSRGGASGQGPSDDYDSAFEFYAKKQEAEKTPARR